MSQNNILLLSIAILILVLTTVPAMADSNYSDKNDLKLQKSTATYSNYIDIREDNINFRIIEEYSGSYAINLKHSIDVDNDGTINSSETDKFIESYIEIRKDEFKEYIVINAGETELDLVSINMNLVDIEGNISDTEADALVTTDIQFEILDSFSTGENHVWIQGHPLIEEKKIILPKGLEVSSLSGLEISGIYVENERVVLTGASGMSSTVIDGETTYEYATQLYINKKAFYEHPYFLPFLGLIFIILMGMAIASLERDRRENE